MDQFISVMKSTSLLCSCSGLRDLPILIQALLKAPYSGGRRSWRERAVSHGHEASRTFPHSLRPNLRNREVLAFLDLRLSEQSIRLFGTRICHRHHQRNEARSQEEKVEGKLSICFGDWYVIFGPRWIFSSLELRLLHNFWTRPRVLKGGMESQSMTILWVWLWC